MNELLHSFFESISTSVNGVTRRTRLTAARAADTSAGRYRGRDVGRWEVERRTMGRDMSEVERAGREENLLGAGVGVVGRFCCSFVVGVVVVVGLALAVSWQSTEADRPRLKNLLMFLLIWISRFLEGVLGEELRSCSGEALWTSVDVGLALCGCGCGSFANVNIRMIMIIQEKTGRGQRGEGTRHKGEEGGGGGYSLLVNHQGFLLIVVGRKGQREGRIWVLGGYGSGRGYGHPGIRVFCVGWLEEDVLQSREMREEGRMKRSRSAPGEKEG